MSHWVVFISGLRLVRSRPFLHFGPAHEGSTHTLAQTLSLRLGPLSALTVSQLRGGGVP